ncbi:MAG: hypothetical protein MSA53_05220 [Bacteroidales bacterium]|nr:hypothetical protein [Bacteroidales bacterium]
MFIKELSYGLVVAHRIFYTAYKTIKSIILVLYIEFVDLCPVFSCAFLYDRKYDIPIRTIAPWDILEK